MENLTTLYREIYRCFTPGAGACIDSRSVRPKCIFFGLPGARVDGADYARAALAAGARLAVVERADLEGVEGVVVVPNAREALQQVALLHRDTLRIPIVAITGSNGKTTTRLLTVAALATELKVGGTEGNLNNDLGVPLSLLGLQPGIDIAVLELGANHPGEIRALCQIARPTHGLITGIGNAHLEGFGSLEGVAHAKGELFEYLKETGGLAFVNGDDKLVVQMAQRVHMGCMASSYTRAAYRAQGHLDANGFLSLEFTWAGRQYVVNTQLAGLYNIPNVLAAIHVASYFGVEMPRVVEGISQYHPENNRSAIVQRGERRLLVDCYNANPTSMRAALESFFMLPSRAGKVAILGEMRELGSASRASHAEIVELLREHPDVGVVLVGKEWSGLEGDYPRFDSCEACKDSLQSYLPNGVLVLLKGSRGVELEKLLEIL